jgi:uncharacterized caspase-like protein
MKRTIGSRAIGMGLAKVEPTSPNTLIAFASKAGSTASDGDSKNSPFTAALVRHIAKPGLDLRKAFGFVRDDVLKNTSNKQEPYVYGSLGGDDVPLVPAKLVVSEPLQNAQADVRRRALIVSSPASKRTSRILFDLDPLQDVPLSRAHARQVGCGSTYRHASVDNGVMKLLQHEANG